MRKSSKFTLGMAGVLGLGLAFSLVSQVPDGPPPGDPNGGPGQDGPPGGGPMGGFGGGRGGPFGGPGGGPGFMQQERKILKQFDKDGDHKLNAEERKTAREYLAKEGTQNRRGFGPRGPGRGSSEPRQPGAKLSPQDVPAYPDAGFYDPSVVRTIFIQFEESDWEKELSEFHKTDVDVPATVTVDGKTYQDVGVRFRGMSSYMMVGEGEKRSLNLSLDMVHDHQNVRGYRTLNLLNAHEDPSFLRSVLFSHIAQTYIPATKANFVRVVINGESWGVYINSEQYNKDSVKEWFGTTKGARWKVVGSPGGRGSLAYLGEDPKTYKSIYSIRTKDEPKVWTHLIQLCKVLSETSPDKLEEALSPLLDIDGALRFLALENALINNDGYWIRTSDYNLYMEENGKFHLIPHDDNETFSLPGGPGFGGGPGGPGGFGGPGGPGGFGPGMMLAPQFIAQADQNNDQKITGAEMGGLAERWYAKLDQDKAGKVDQERFAGAFDDLFPPPEGFGGPGGPGGPGGGGRGGFGPGRFLGPQLFTALDADKDGNLTKAELKATLEKWSKEWDKSKQGSLSEEDIRTGLGGVFVMRGMRGGMAGPGGPGGPDAQGGPGGPGGQGGQGGGRRGFGGGFGGGGGVRINGVELDPLIAAKDESKPLLSKLLAVPSLRTRYLGYVKDIAEKWLDWERLGPVAQKYHQLIAEHIAADTRKLSSTEAFEKSLTENVRGGGGPGPGGGETIGLKVFAEKRRAYLLNLPEIKNLAR